MISDLALVVTRTKLVQQIVKIIANIYNSFPIFWPYAKHYLGDSFIGKLCENGYRSIKQYVHDIASQHPDLCHYFVLLKSEAASKIFTIGGVSAAVFWLTPVSSNIAIAAITSSGASMVVGIYYEAKRHVVIENLHKENELLIHYRNVKIIAPNHMNNALVIPEVSFLHKLRNNDTKKSIITAFKSSFWENMVPIVIATATGQIYAPVKVLGYTLYEGYKTTIIALFSASGGFGYAVYNRINSDYKENQIRVNNQVLRASLEIQHIDLPQLLTELNKLKSWQELNTKAGDMSPTIMSKVPTVLGFSVGR
jgi:hypothetical protein